MKWNGKMKWEREIDWREKMNLSSDFKKGIIESLFIFLSYLFYKINKVSP